jgi:hypothetical protein
VTWPFHTCPICDAPRVDHALLGVLAKYSCSTMAFESGEFSQGKDCIEPEEEPSRETQAQQPKASAKGRVETPVPGATPKKTRSRKQAGVSEVPSRVRRKRAS